MVFFLHFVSSFLTTSFLVQGGVAASECRDAFRLQKMCETSPSLSCSWNKRLGKCYNKDDETIGKEDWPIWWGKLARTSIKVGDPSNWHRMNYGLPLGALGITRCPWTGNSDLDLQAEEFSLDLSTVKDWNEDKLKQGRTMGEYIKHQRFAYHGTMTTGTNFLSYLLWRSIKTAELDWEERERLWAYPDFMRKDENGEYWEPLNVWNSKHKMYDRNVTTIEELYKSAHYMRETCFHSSCYNVVIVKHPLTWIKSLCEKQYDFEFDVDRCPHPEKMGRTRFKNYDSPFDNIVAAWNNYYGFWASGVIRNTVIVRYEDLLYEASTGRVTTIEQVAQRCVFLPNSNVTMDKGKIFKGWYKENGYGLEKAVEKYANPGSMYDGYSRYDLMFLRIQLDKDLLKLFNYRL